MNKKEFIRSYKLMMQFILIILVLLVLIPFSQFIDFNKQEVNPAKITKIKEPEIADGIHLETGLKVDENWDLVQMNCTRCHSATIITKSQFTKDGWKDLIVWMQKTQGLWDLGENEDKILDYLSKNYAPMKKIGRREPLEIEEEEWYILE